MAERKVLNKYIPPNFNPNSQVRLPGSKTGQKKVRLMAPFSMRCNTCGEFIYKGKKFNARKEDAYDEEYLGIQIYRFYIRCPLCASEITFKTDPQNTDYTAEHGAQRNFEPWREETRAHQEVKAERLAKEENNAMLALENRTLDNIMDALDEIRTKNAMLERVDPESLLEKIYGSSVGVGPSGELPLSKTELEDLQDAEDDRISKLLFTDAAGEHVKRVKEEERPKPVSSTVKKETQKRISSLISLGIKRKAVDAVDGIAAVEPKVAPSEPISILAISYDSDSD